MADPVLVTLSLLAMATRFELALYGEDPVRLRAAGEEALGAVERIEAQLSFYRTDSEVRWINAYAAQRPIPVEPRLFRLLQRCAERTRETDGAFDITIGPLMRAWKFVGATGGMPSPADLENARAVVGMQRIHLDDASFTVAFERPGIEMDLGAVGKGYAIECAVEILQENGVRCALLHGGTSTVFAIGRPPDKESWRVAVRNPLSIAEPLRVIDLVDQSLSVSAPHGKSFHEGGREYGHVIDPRSGEPVQGAWAAAIIGPSPTDSDALSTALLVLGDSGLRTLMDRFPAYAGLVASGPAADRIKITTVRL